ncbi:velvet factor-domain-containing protein [Cunninghamella echinulata]|nr:velvet factor-domain-containing protein [Cunninghamella echinulata]
MTKQESSCSYRFISSSLTELPSRDYNITIRQQPERAKMSIINERDKRPIEPPPILQMKWINCSEEETKKCLQSPFYFVVANLLDVENNDQLLTPTQNYLHGTTVSSLYRLRDIDNKDGGFFVFGDLSVKKDGVFKLQFNLFEIVEGDVQTRYTIISNPFTVFLPKRFPGPLEATFLSRTFSDQGVKMRIRKEHRLQTAIPRKRKSSEQKTNNDNKTKKIATESYIKSSLMSSSSLSSANEVYFGKFSSNNTSQSTSSSSSSSSSSTMLIDNSESFSSLHTHTSSPSSMYKFHHYDTSIYPTPQSSTDLISDIKQLHIQRSSSPISTSTTSSPSSKPYSMPPSPTYTIHHPYSSSPPSSNLNHSFPSITGNLNNYHLTSSSSSSISTAAPYHYLPSSSLTPPPPPPPPPPSSSSPHWGNKLPPLKMIFNENHQHQHHPSLFSKTSSSNWQLPPITTHYS